MSPQDRRRGYGASNNRTTLGYWVPLAITVTVATAGLIAWVWNERKDSEKKYESDGKPPRPADDRPGGYGQGPGAYPQGPSGSYPPGSGPPYPQGGGVPYPQGPPGPPGAYPYEGPRGQGEDPSIISRVQDAYRRTPSPQQFFDQASKRVTAGVAAAGAVVGNALSSITEEKGDYEDHSRWSEEARTGGQSSTVGQTGVKGSGPTGIKDKRKIVAIVVSSEMKGTEEARFSEAHTSILSHLPEHIADDARVFVLIYSPDPNQKKPPPSVASSYSNIGHDDAQTPGEESEKPLTAVSPQPFHHSSLFDVLYTQAQAIVDKETQIMPFSTPSGYVQILRQVAPQIVYVQSSLSGENGEAVKNISGWVGQVVLVVGDESGHGGLVDSEDEHGVHGVDAKNQWWTNDPKIGLGQIEIAEAIRFGEDWRRRVRGHD